MSNNKIIPELRFPEFKNEGEWKSKKLGKICHILRGSAFSKADIIENGENKCIHYGELFTKYNEIIKTIISRTDVSSGTFSEKGDILMPTSDVTPNGLAKACALNVDNVLLGGDINVLRIKKDVNCIYLSYFLNNNKRNILKLVVGTTVKHIYASDIKTLPIVFPSSPLEQQKIADCLSSLDEVIEGYEERLLALQDHKRGLMQNLFPQEGKTKPKYRFPEFKNNGDWEEKKLGEILDNESSNISLNKLELDPTGYPVYGADGLVGYVDNYKQNEDYIAIIKDGSGVGRLYYYQGKSSILGTLTYLKPVDLDMCNLLFQYYLLNTIDFSSYIKGSGIPHIYYSDYRDEKTTIPKPHEQQKIADCLSSIDNLITEQTERIEQLRQHKRGLMQGLFPKIEE